jgi:hypothetical protein
MIEYFVEINMLVAVSRNYQKTLWGLETGDSVF